MEDLYLFTLVPVTLDNIRELAQATGLKPEEFIQWDDYEQADLRFLNIYLGGYTTEMKCSAKQDIEVIKRPDYCQWSAWKDFTNFSAIVQERILTSRPENAFLVSFHVSSLITLSLFLSKVLEKWEGWIVCDFKEETIYELHNIHSLIEVTYQATF
jgi:hypothetical protein